MTAVVELVEGLARIEVDGVACVAYPGLTGPVETGDEVLVNVLARELELGSGGFDVLYANLTRGLHLQAQPGAHVMKLPYTPLQFATRHGEEETALAERPELAGIPVVACSLHSQVAPACAPLRGLSVAYIQVPGGALPLPLSDAVRELKGAGLLGLTVAAGACFGGDVDTVNVFSALAVAHARGAEAIVCGIGPGVVGTGTSLGHGGLAAADALGAARALGGAPVLAARISEHDPRERHRGLSHHTQAVLSLRDGSYEVAWPSGCPIGAPDGATEVDVSEWREACEGLALEHMGRGPDDDPWFFAAAFAAGKLAGQLAR